MNFKGGEALNHRSYLSLAIPFIISTMTTPLLGVIDTAVVGQLSDPSYIGGVAVGTIIFNTMYWLFGFLRVSTSGFAAQALGANDQVAGILALLRPLLIALVVGMSFILLQWPIEYLSLTIIHPEQDVSTLASHYFSIRIWGAPFALMNYVILGWLMGMAKVKETLFLQVYMNVFNIILDFLFVKLYHLDVNGVAIATLIAEVSTFVIGVLLLKRYSRFPFKWPSQKVLLDSAPFKRMMSVNRDLLIRTICLLIVFNVFTVKGASFGTEILAANAILIQVQFVMAYILDGFANASSIFSGKAVGSKNERLLDRTISLSCQWAIFSSMLIAATYYIFKEPIIQLFTKNNQVIELVEKYDAWIVLFPISSSFGLILYGIFTGATETVPVRNSMMFSLCIYLLSLYLILPKYDNHGLWLAFILFSLGRSVFLTMYLSSFKIKHFQQRRKNQKDVIIN